MEPELGWDGIYYINISGMYLTSLSSVNHRTLLKDTLATDTVVKSDDGGFGGKTCNYATA